MIIYIYNIAKKTHTTHVIKVLNVFDNEEIKGKKIEGETGNRENKVRQ